MTLCQRCRLLSFDPSRIGQDDAREGYFIPLNYEIEDNFPFLSKLTKSAQDGCDMCDFLKKAIWIHLDVPFQNDAKISKSNIQVSSKIIRIVLSEYHAGTQFLHDPRNAEPKHISGHVHLDRIASSIEIEVEDLRDTGFGIGGKDFPEALALTEKSLQMMHDWISSCVGSKSHHHQSCSRTRDNAAPSRLLDVMDGDTLRLVETEGTSVNYAILSYCWGRSKAGVAARTCKSNVSDRMNAISLSSLPPTLQDSITVVRKLGIQYLWIDSMCIVQDSGEFSEEAGRMMSYYENSYLTIIPIMCSSVDQGFLGPRPRWISKRLLGMFAGQPTTRLQLYYPGWERLDVEAKSSIWDTRAWTFQERLLSTRTLYFGRNGIGFECRGAVYQEVNLGVSEQSDHTKFLPVSSPNSQSSEWDNLDIVRSKWYLIVMDYVERQLTYESDKLVALSGVAQRFGILFKGEDEYISGFWKNDLCHGLCWRTWLGTLRRLQGTWLSSKSDLFPSWSWCSMKKPVRWTDGTASIPCAELLGKVKTLDHNKCGGQNEYAKLVLAAWIFPARLLEVGVPKGLELEIRLDSKEEPSEDFQATDVCMAVIMCTYLDGGDEDRWRASPSTMMHEVYGLLVEEKGTWHGSIEEFSRFGVFDVVLDMGIDTADDSGLAAKYFYERIYSCRRTIALV